MSPSHSLRVSHSCMHMSRSRMQLQCSSMHLSHSSIHLPYSLGICHIQGYIYHIPYVSALSSTHLPYSLCICHIQGHMSYSCMNLSHSGTHLPYSCRNLLHSEAFSCRKCLILFYPLSWIFLLIGEDCKGVHRPVSSSIASKYPAYQIPVKVYPAKPFETLTCCMVLASTLWIPMWRVRRATQTGVTELAASLHKCHVWCH